VIRNSYLSALKSAIWPARHALAALVVLSAASACGGGNDDNPADPTGSATEIASPGSPTQTAREVRGLHEIPDTFPSDFPIYAGVVIDRADDLTTRFFIEMTAADQPADVIGFYEEQLASGPWQAVTVSVIAVDRRLIDFSGENDETGRVGIIPSGENRTKIIVDLVLGE
jgi:hypothetical protein